MAKKSSGKRLNVYANLSHKRKTKKDASARKRAQYLATLPKHPLKRTLYRLHPKRVAKYWFSKRGGIMALKIVGISVLLGVLLVGGLFAYFRKDLDQIRPGELAKNVQTTVTKYYDRNGVLLWEDKGDGNYKLVVKDEEISDYLKQATIAIEDRDFRSHAGISVSGITRALINNTQGESVQGGSTLTQQLVKQVFFADEAQERGLAGIPRKIKEIILAIEVERMYDKDQILALYLNESPYGGRRNGAESAAQTYFGKSAKELNLAESALLAAIPNQPGLYDPYNLAGNDALIARQHKVLNAMAEQGFVSQAEADEAKKIAILDTLEPVADQFKDIKAPHFVQMVRSELESKLGKAVVGKGGLTVKTTLDYRIQQKLEQEMDAMFSSYQPGFAGFTNGAGSIEDVRTGQVIAMLGSRDFNYPGYGQDNAAMAFIQPGSSIKPLVYAQLFQNQGDDQPNYGSGSILSDLPTTFDGGYKPLNADGGYRGNINIRTSLGLSRNIPAIKAMSVAGVEETLTTIRQLGDKFYCTQGQEQQVGLSSAIGGCGTRMIDHVNALASLGRLGVYKPHTSVLEVTNTSGDVLQKYKDEQKSIIDAQSAYIVSEILADDNARRGLFGRTITPELDAANINVAIKTGTSDIDRKPKDIWTIGYTPSLSMAVWLGNPDTKPLANGNSSIPAEILDPVMAYATNLYIQDEKAKAGEWFTRPTGIQVINGELFPSYYNKRTAATNAKLTFDKLSKKRATDCTPQGARIDIDVLKQTDPVSKQDIFIAPNGYDSSRQDDVHECNDAKPNISVITEGMNSITVNVVKGTFALDKFDVRVNNRVITTINYDGRSTYSVPYNLKPGDKVSASVSDTGFYSSSSSTVTATPAPQDDD